MSAPRILVGQVAPGADDCIAVTGAELHHLRVRRVRVGDTVTLTDGALHEWTGEVVRLTQHAAKIRLRQAPAIKRESPLEIELALALIKPDRLSLAIEKTTELGVTRIVVYNADRSIGTASTTRQDRWQRVAAAATKQSQRTRVPVIEGPLPFAEMIARAAGDERIVVWEAALAAATFRGLGDNAPTRVHLLVGPEGGFSAAELHHAQRAGFRPASLGPRVLRAETAAIAAVTLAQATWGDLGRPPVL